MSSCSPERVVESQTKFVNLLDAWVLLVAVLGSCLILSRNTSRQHGKPKTLNPKPGPAPEVEPKSRHTPKSSQAIFPLLQERHHSAVSNAPERKGGWKVSTDRDKHAKLEVTILLDLAGERDLQFGNRTISGDVSRFRVHISAAEEDSINARYISVCACVFVLVWLSCIAV